MNKFNDQFSSILKKEEIEVHTRLIYELMSIANNNGFINVYEGFSDIEKPDVLLSNERDYLFYGDAKLCKNGAKSRTEVVDTVSRHIDGCLKHIHDKLLPGGMIAIYTGGLIEKEDWEPMIRQARERRIFNFVQPFSDLRHFFVVDLYVNINMISQK